MEILRKSHMNNHGFQRSGEDVTQDFTFGFIEPAPQPSRLVIFAFEIIPSHVGGESPSLVCANDLNKL